jgi:protein-S-isoprenylcysteine O-methyltransferase Ste14
LLGPWTRGFVGGVVLTAGVALAMAGRERFREAGTNVEPWNPAVRVVTAGVYQYVRNPMYVGLMLMVGGLGVALASDWALVMIVPLALTLRNGVVLREEFYLERKFGDEYRRFKARVPRWGIW